MNINRAIGIIAVAFLLTALGSGRSEEPSSVSGSTKAAAPADTGGMKGGGMMMGGRGMSMMGGPMSGMGMQMPMMGMMGMAGGCPMMMEKGEKLEVEKIEQAEFRSGRRSCG